MPTLLDRLRLSGLGSPKCGFRRDGVQEAKAPAPDDGIKEFIFVLNA